MIVIHSFYDKFLSEIRYNYRKKIMKDTLILEGKTYISARRASKVISYAQDYIGQLCRAGKLDCRMVGRSWFVTEASLIAHRDATLDVNLEKVSTTPKNTEAVIDLGIDTGIENLNIEKIENIKTDEKEGIENVKQTIKEALKKVALKSDIIPEALPSPFTYESITAPALPPLAKKVPSHFSIPTAKFIEQVTPASHARAISYVDASKSVLVIALLAVTGALATFTMTPVGSTFTTNLTSSIYSVSQNLIEKTSHGLGAVTTRIGDYFGQGADVNTQVAIETPTPTPVSSVTNKTVNTENFSGISIVPSKNSANLDEATKAKIRNTFSDEVVVNADNSGTAGIVRPVFKKAGSDDFVYVLVPVKEAVKGKSSKDIQNVIQK